MGLTADALNNGTHPVIQCVVAIEGFKYLVTNGPTGAAWDAFQNSAYAGHTDYFGAVGGLSIKWDQRQRIDPWKPCLEPPALQFTVVPADGGEEGGRDGDLRLFTRSVFKRSGGFETRLRSTLDCDDTTMTVASASAFPAAGDVYVGPETMGYPAKDATNFNTLVRGKYNPFYTSDGSRFARAHRYIDLSTTVGEAIGVKLQPVVSSELRGLVGRWVGVYILRADKMGGTLDTPPHEAHLAFAGIVHEVAFGEHGEVIVTCEDLRRKIYETTILRDQFRAQVAEGIFLSRGMEFTCENTRQVSGGGTTLGTANPLLVVAAGAIGSDQIDEGLYTVGELGSYINEWLQGERAAARLLFSVQYTAIHPTENGSRGKLEYDDGTSTGGLARKCVFRFPNEWTGEFFGWDGAEVTASSTSRIASVVSPNTPWRIRVATQPPMDALIDLNLENACGSWATQRTLLPSAFLDTAGLIDGLLKIGDRGYVKCRYVTDSFVQINAFGTTSYFGPALELFKLTVDDEDSLEVSQVLVLEGPFKELLLKILLSTGTSGFNHPDYDVLGEQLGCAIPWACIENGVDDLVDDLDALETGDLQLCAIVDKPTRFCDLFDADFLLRWCFFVWGGGRLRMRSWTTPVAAYASTTLDETSKAVPAASAATDKQRAPMREDFESIYNIIKIASGMTAAGDYSEPGIPIVDAESFQRYGSRTRTINARNTVRGSGAVALDVSALIAKFCATWPMFSRPFWRVSRPIAQTKYETCFPGVVAALSDRALPNPETGEPYDHRTGTGGVSGWPCIVASNRHDWGGVEPGFDGGEPRVRDAGGEVEVIMFPRVVSGVYAPCAQVDDTMSSGGFSAGYDHANRTLQFYANEHSQASTAASDVGYFGAGYEARIIEIDPPDPATPLTWVRTIQSRDITTHRVVFTVALSAPAWDATKKYRMTFAGYTACTAEQQAHVFQADDADGMIADVRQPYGLIVSGQGQSQPYNDSPPTETPALYAAASFGDGVPLDVGYERDAARLANNLLSYKTAGQGPCIYEDLRTYGGASTWELQELAPIFLGLGQFSANLTQKLWVAPYMRSTDGTQAEVRVTLSRNMPTGDTRDDVDFGTEFVQVTFTRSLTTFAIVTEQALDIRHCKLTEGLLGGIGFLSVEIKVKGGGGSNCEYGGLAARRLGPLVTP